jgi:hypothetical protein
MEMREAWGLLFAGRSHQKANFPVGHPGKFVGHVPSEKYDEALDAVLAHLPAVLGAVEFYADNANWQSRVIRTVFDSEGNITGQECETGPAWDAGARARQALGLQLSDGTSHEP